MGGGGTPLQGGNNISKACHTSTASLYADDTEMHSSSKDIDLAENNVNEDLKSVRHWFRRNGLICNTKKNGNFGYCVPECT